MGPLQAVALGPPQAVAPNSKRLDYDLTVWTQQTCLAGEHAIAEPKRLRYRILHVAARLTRQARRTTLHLQDDWPWAAALLAAFDRLGVLPAYG